LKGLWLRKTDEGPLAQEDRIVGGVEAVEHTWPWQVALFIDDAWFCGGSIISENYVLTAAHCADGAGYFDVMAGAHNVRASSEPHRVEVTSYNGWTHPQWNEEDLSNDLALIELPSPLPMSDYITTSCLPAAGDVPSVGTHHNILPSSCRRHPICGHDGHCYWMGEALRLCRWNLGRAQGSARRPNYLKL